MLEETTVRAMRYVLQKLSKGLGDREGLVRVTQTDGGVRALRRGCKRKLCKTGGQAEVAGTVATGRETGPARRVYTVARCQS